MKVSKRQLKRIIREEKAKFLDEQLQSWDDEPTAESPYAVPGTAGHTQAMDDLEMELINALSRAMEEGLIIDDLNDAWQNAMAYAEDML